MTDKQPEVLQQAAWLKKEGASCQRHYDLGVLIERQHSELETLRASHGQAPRDTERELEMTQQQECGNTPYDEGPFALAQPVAQRGAAYAELPEPDATTVGLGAVWNRHSMRDFADRTHALRAQQPAPATQKLTEQICISDTNQSAACAVGNVGTTSDAQTTRSTHDAPATKQVGDVVAYLDVGAGGYLDLGSALSDEAMQQLPKGRHALVIAGTYGIDGYVAAPQPSPTPKADSQPAPVVDQKSLNLSDKAACASTVIDKPAPLLDRDRIREIFMEHGFTVKEGQTDLKQYVYDAADALLRAARVRADSVSYDYAKQIAESMWATHYKADAPHWESCDNLMGVLSQISNMMYGLSRTQANSVTAASGGEVMGPEWKWVPVDATDAMVRATDKVNFENEDTDGTIYNVWNTMLAAAPTPPIQAAGNVLEDAGGANWQDISTAPKDGTRFVVVGNDYGLDNETQHICIAQWFRGCWMEVSEWNDASELKYLTHWMPLPPLPGNAARKEGGA